MGYCGIDDGRFYGAIQNMGQPDWDWWGKVWPTPGATLRSLEIVPVEAHTRSIFVVELEELVQVIEPPPLFLVGLIEAFDLPNRLWSTDFAESVNDVVLGEVALKMEVETRPLILAGIDEFRAVVGDHLDDRTSV